MSDFLPELWLEQLKFLPGNEVYRCKLISKKWKDFIEKCEASLPKPTNFPSCLNPEDKFKTVGVSDDKMSAEYLQEYDFNDFGNVGSVRSDFPIPLVHGLYYFEVNIVNAGARGRIGVGISRKCFNLNNEPGWRRFSFGYHGDDGKFFSQHGWGLHFGPLYTTGDVIGCGFNMVERKLFYTKNGVFIGVARPYMKIFPDWYPTIGLHSPGEVVEVNFGQQPFLYDINPEMEKLQGRPLPLVEESYLHEFENSPKSSSYSSSESLSMESSDSEEQEAHHGVQIGIDIDFADWDLPHISSGSSSDSSNESENMESSDEEEHEERDDIHVD